MMDEKTNGLLLALEKELEGFVSLAPIERMRSEIAAVKSALLKLYEFYTLSGFARRSEEIVFFKVVKPRFYSLLILAMERYWKELERPMIGAGADLASFYDRQLEHIARFFRQHEFFYQYYRLGGVELDEQYFVRDTVASVLVNSDVPDLDPAYSTIGDYLFSKFMALERLREEILLEMQGGGELVVSVRSRKGRELRWTGDASNLIEILYGVFETKQFNDGEVDIADLVDVFERVFHVNLSNYFQRFAKIKQRKLVSKTKFLDEMVVAVAKRIDDADAFVPSWAK